LRKREKKNGFGNTNYFFAIGNLFTKWDYVIGNEREIVTQEYKSG
jgi:hypothetical protein